MAAVRTSKVTATLTTLHAGPDSVIIDARNICKFVKVIFVQDKITTWRPHEIFFGPIYPIGPYKTYLAFCLMVIINEPLQLGT
jgi:hypothetical protein